MNTVYPSSISEIAGVLAQKQTVEVIGLGSKRAWGRQVEADLCLSTRDLSGVLFYEPDEMVISAKAGTPVSQLLAVLSAHQQRLAFEPPNWNDWLAPTQSDQTIGGVVACNLSGSARWSAGAARDHLLGFQAVNGRGELFKSGGRVVKNVTGYDLSKLMAGSFGTLAVLTEVTLKTVPLPEFEATVALKISDARDVLRQFVDSLRSSLEIVAAAWLPLSQAQQIGFDSDVALLRLEGFEASVRERAAQLLSDIAYDHSLLEGKASSSLWQALSNGVPLAQETASAIWRISVPPASAVEVLKALPKAGQAWLDWAGGLIWFAVPDSDGDSGFASPIRQTITECGGHASLIRARPETRRAVPAFQPGSLVQEKLTSRIKSAFDPDGLLNPGRMT